MKTATQSNVYFFSISENENILTEMNLFNETAKYKGSLLCYGTGNKAFKSAMKNVKPNEVVYQIKVSIDRNEILYKY